MAKKQPTRAKEADPLAVLRANKVFRHLPLDALRQLAARGRVEHFHERTLLVRREETPQQLRYILTGGLGTSLSTRDGKEASLPPHRPGEWATWPGCFLDAPLAHDLWCMPRSRFIAFPKSAVRAAIAGSPEAAMEVIGVISRSLRFLTAWSLATGLVSDEQRLARLLFHIADNNDEKSAGEAAVLLTHEQIGQLGFGSRQHAARLLGVLQAKGLVELHYSSIRIHSRNALREFAFTMN